MTKEQCNKEKEIIDKNERWCRISKEGCEVVISSTYKEDSLFDITKEADRLASKHSNNNKQKYIN